MTATDRAGTCSSSAISRHESRGTERSSRASRPGSWPRGRSERCGSRTVPWSRCSPRESRRNAPPTASPSPDDLVTRPTKLHGRPRSRAIACGGIRTDERARNTSRPSGPAAPASSEPLRSTEVARSASEVAGTAALSARPRIQRTRRRMTYDVPLEKP